MLFKKYNLFPNLENQIDPYNKHPSLATSWQARSGQEMTSWNGGVTFTQGHGRKEC